MQWSVALPAGSTVMKQAFDAFVAELLAGLQEGAGRDTGSLAGQQNIELVDELGHVEVTKHGHADDGPDMPLHEHATTRKVATPSSLSREVTSAEGIRLESEPNWVVLLAWR